MTRRRWIAANYTPTTATLTGTQADHLVRVLRAKPGYEADVAAGERVFRAVVESVADEEVVFRLIEETSRDQALPVTLVLSVFKFDRMEWAIEKATELGVAVIAPVLAQRTEKHLAIAADKRVERWRRLTLEAAKQSRRSSIPTVLDPLPLEKRIREMQSNPGILLSENEHDETLRTQWDRLSRNDGETLPEIALAIGPEGGWTAEEEKLFAQYNWRAATLGPRILRAETAAIASLAIVASLLETPQFRSV